MSARLDRIEKTIDRIVKANEKVVVAQQKTEAAQQKTEAALASFTEKTEAAQQKTEAAQQKTEAGIQELKMALSSFIQSNEVSMTELRQELGGIGITIGGTAEDLFRRNIKGTLTRRGIVIDRVMNNIEYPGGEFDLLCPNGIYVVLVEVKARLHSSDIDFFIKKQIPAFRKYFVEYKDHKLIGGLASMAMNHKLEKRVEESGLFLFTQTEEGGASIANRSDFSPKFY